MGVEEQIKEIEEELARTKYNKATEGHIGRQKAKLAKLKEQQQKKAGGARGLGYGLKKAGDATVVLVGFPSVGKSTLLNQLTNADSKVGSYDFTTLEVIPGVMELNGAKIQVWDVPGLIECASAGKGRGKEVLSVIRAADLIVMVADARDAVKQRGVMENELYQAGFRLNQEKPQVFVTKSNIGGIDISSAVKLTKVSKAGIKEILKEFKFMNGEVLIRQDVTQDQIIDSIMRNRIYIPALAVANKIDLVKTKPPGFVCISAKEGEDLGNLREEIWEKLGLVRIYLKRVGKEPDMEEPLILKKGVTVKEVTLKVHKIFEEYFKFARIWGPSARYPGQQVGIDFRLQDQDIVEVHS